MLGPTYRFTGYNATGQVLAIGAIAVDPRRWKYASDGSITDEASGTADAVAQAGTLANGAYVNGTTQDNTPGAAKWIGGQFELTVTAPASSAGDVVVYCERSVDGGTTWPDAGQGEWLWTFTFSGAATKRKTVEL